MFRTPQAVLRVEKLKSIKCLRTAARHNSRTTVVLNADENKTVEILQGQTSPEAVIELAQVKIGSQKIRKNAVIAGDILLGASPSYFRPSCPENYGYWQQKQLVLWTEASTNWLEEHIGSNILQTALHLDEATPHIHCLWVPINNEGKLSYRSTEFGGTRSGLSKLQDSYAAAVTHLGIERGIKFSPARHQQIRQYYTAVNSTETLLDLNSWLPPPEHQETAPTYRQRSIALLQPGSDTINRMLAERDLAVQQQELEREKAIRAQKYREQVERELAAEKTGSLALTEKISLLSQFASCCFVLAEQLQADLKTNSVSGSQWQFRVQNGCVEIKNRRGFELSAPYSDFARSVSLLAPPQLQQLTEFSNLLQATVRDRLANQKNANLQL
ncbi:MobV family relaxase [Microcoleus sp. PH2017_30_WIL_O_A]|uniref:MobV family relaxase n=1 Tax=Microcoleus sp. PH2017_30_WIL_O_A TaxID=2798840 RepID=UPI001E063346|nr:MobV family relaxase [Microcoleus sp. PH2017_30_WIL_O_A]MCC3587989.1 plasmid recombination protein [Microcoleus sp. PH2017_30_WIL_O_A]